MTDGHDCYQNALAERVNGILKTELLLQRRLILATPDAWSSSQRASIAASDRI